MGLEWHGNAQQNLTAAVQLLKTKTAFYAEGYLFFQTGMAM
jgi:hypothetical protein